MFVLSTLWQNTLSLGVCPLTQALMTVNSRLRELYPDSEELFDIVLMTNNHAQVGVRLINSINHYGMLHPLQSIVDCNRTVAAAAHPLHYWQT